MVTKPVIDESHQHLARSSINATTSTIAAIHQPNYIPWLGYFFKISQADKFVFLDTVAYSHGSYVNRNCVKTPNGAAWLTVPTRRSGRFGQLICETETNNIRQWTGRHMATLRSNYGRASYFEEILALLEPHYRVVTDDGRSLADFNIGVICSIATYLGFGTHFTRASELNVSGHKTDLLVDICRAVGANQYLAGAGGKSYQDDTKFEDAGIAPIYSNFSQRPYPQLFGEFIGDLSVVDVLMNCGYPGTRRLLGFESDRS